MPTVLRIGPYRFFFYSNEGQEPRHIHIRSGDGEAKYWLQPVSIAWYRGYNERQLKQIERHLNDNLVHLIESWDAYFQVEDNDE